MLIQIYRILNYKLRGKGKGIHSLTQQKREEKKKQSTIGPQIQLMYK